MADLSARDREVLGLTLAGEIDPRVTPYGGGAEQDGASILETIVTRLESQTPGRYGATGGMSSYGSIADVVLQPSQFSTWNDEQGRNVARYNYEKFAPQINAIIDGYFDGSIEPVARGITHYYNPSIVNPGWARNTQEVGQTAGHRYMLDPGVETAVARARTNQPPETALTYAETDIPAPQFASRDAAGPIDDLADLSDIAAALPTSGPPPYFDLGEAAPISYDGAIPAPPNVFLERMGDVPAPQFEGRTPPPAPVGRQGEVPAPQFASRDAAGPTYDYAQSGVPGQVDDFSALEDFASLDPFIGDYFAGGTPAPQFADRDVPEEEQIVTARPNTFGMTPARSEALALQEREKALRELLDIARQEYNAADEAVDRRAGVDDLGNPLDESVGYANPDTYGMMFSGAPAEAPDTEGLRFTDDPFGFSMLDRGPMELGNFTVKALMDEPEQATVAREATRSIGGAGQGGTPEPIANTRIDRGFNTLSPRDTGDNFSPGFTFGSMPGGGFSTADSLERARGNDASFFSGVSGGDTVFGSTNSHFSADPISSYRTSSIFNEPSFFDSPSQVASTPRANTSIPGFGMTALAFTAPQAAPDMTPSHFEPTRSMLDTEGMTGFASGLGAGSYFTDLTGSIFDDTDYSAALDAFTAPAQENEQVRAKPTLPAPTDLSRVPVNAAPAVTQSRQQAPVEEERTWRDIIGDAVGGLTLDFAPEGMATRWADAGQGIGRAPADYGEDFWSGYTQFGGQQDTASMARAMAIEQQARRNQGLKTFGGAIGGAFSGGRSESTADSGISTGGRTGGFGQTSNYNGLSVAHGGEGFGMGAGGNYGTSGAGGASTGGSRVLCTYFMQKGELPKALWRADLEWTRKHCSDTTVRGYHWWAVPAVIALRKRERWALVAEPFFRFITQHRAKEIAYHAGVVETGSFCGKLVRWTLEPLSYAIGTVLRWRDIRRDWRDAYRDSAIPHMRDKL